MLAYGHRGEDPFVISVKPAKQTIAVSRNIGCLDLVALGNRQRGMYLSFALEGHLALRVTPDRAQGEIARCALFNREHFLRRVRIRTLPAEEQEALTHGCGKGKGLALNGVFGRCTLCESAAIKCIFDCIADGGINRHQLNAFRYGA